VVVVIAEDMAVAGRGTAPAALVRPGIQELVADLLLIGERICSYLDERVVVLQIIQRKGRFEVEDNPGVCRLTVRRRGRWDDARQGKVFKPAKKARSQEFDTQAGCRESLPVDLVQDRPEKQEDHLGMLDIVAGRAK
jgi:hypothetical protein